MLPTRDWRLLVIIQGRDPYFEVLCLPFRIRCGRVGYAIRERHEIDGEGYGLLIQRRTDEDLIRQPRMRIQCEKHRIARLYIICESNRCVSADGRVDLGVRHCRSDLVRIQRQILSHKTNQFA